MSLRPVLRLTKKSNQSPANHIAHHNIAAPMECYYYGRTNLVAYIAAPIECYYYGRTNLVAYNL